MPTSYLERLGERSNDVGTVLCVGLDPDPRSMPATFGSGVDGADAFCRLVLDAALEHAAAVKANLAFFEVYGSSGLAVLERVRATVPASVPFILDGKRGDIGSTASRLAAALFDTFGADAVTVNPYLGSSAIEPLLERADRFAYVLCRTTNEGSDELQGLMVADDPLIGAPAEPLALRVARRVVSWGDGQTVGLVVGATAPLDLARVRAVAPGLPFLVPGVGAQGGDLAAALDHGQATAGPGVGRPGGGLLVNVSRGIGGVAHEGGGDPGERIAEAAREWAARLPVLGLRAPVGPRRDTENEVSG